MLKTYQNNCTLSREIVCCGACSVAILILRACTILVGRQLRTNFIVQLKFKLLYKVLFRFSEYMHEAPEQLKLFNENKIWEAYTVPCYTAPLLAHTNTQFYSTYIKRSDFFSIQICFFFENNKKRINIQKGRNSPITMRKTSKFYHRNTQRVQTRKPPLICWRIGHVPPYKTTFFTTYIHTLCDFATPSGLATSGTRKCDGPMGARRF